MSLTVVHSVTELLGPHSCHHCPGSTGYGPWPLATSKHEFKTQILRSFLVRPLRNLKHWCTVPNAIRHPNFSPIASKLTEQLHIFICILPHEQSCHFLTQFSHDLFQTSHASFSPYSWLTVQNSCRSHNWIPRNSSLLHIRTNLLFLARF